MLLRDCENRWIVFSSTVKVFPGPEKTLTTLIWPLAGPRQWSVEAGDAATHRRRDYGDGMLQIVLLSPAQNQFWEAAWTTCTNNWYFFLGFILPPSMNNSFAFAVWLTKIMQLQSLQLSQQFYCFTPQKLQDTLALGIRYKCPHPQCEYPVPTKSGLSVLSKNVHMKIR